MKEIINILKNKAQQQGYITFDEIIAVSEKEELSLRAIDSVTGLLMDEGFLVLENKPAQETGEIVDDSDYDKSHLDYDLIFAEVLKIAPQLSSYIDNVRDIPAPRSGEENELIVLAKERNEYATTRLILMFLKVVIKNALYFHQEYGLPLEETIQEGNIGLIKAIEKFGIESGNRFSTYAPWWIRQNIIRHSMGICDKYYVPVYIRDDLLRLIKHIGVKKIEAAQGNLVQAVDISIAIKATGIKRAKIKKYLIHLEEPFSLEDIDSDQLTPYRQLSNVEEEVLNRLTYQAIRESVSNCLNTLKDRDRKIIELRYGFNGNSPMTLEEIGEIFSITRERVRQIEANVLSNIKPYLNLYSC